MLDNLANEGCSLNQRELTHCWHKLQSSALEPPERCCWCGTHKSVRLVPAHGQFTPATPA